MGGARPRVHYAWVIAGVTFVTLLAAAGFRASSGVLIVPLEEEFGWSRATISIAVSVNLVLFGLAGPFAAALMSRYGLRRIVMTALCLVAAGSGFTVAMTEPWQLILLWGVVVGSGAGCMATVLAATVATRWFVARRGLVTGALTAATATGQLIFLPLLAGIADSPGWRWVSITVACAALGAVPLVALLLRNSPRDVGLTAYGAPSEYEEPAPLQRPIAAAIDGLRAARKHGAFWLLAGSFFVCGASTNGLIATHFIAAATDHRIHQTTAAGLLAMIGIFDIAGTLASGWLTDRWDPRRLLLVYYALRGLSLLVLEPVLETRGSGLLGFMVFYGLDWVATVPPTVALCTEVFGPNRGGVVYGWVFAAHQIGAAVMAWFAGATRGWTGAYQVSFVAAGVLCIVAALGTQRIRRQTLNLEPAVVAA